MAETGDRSGLKSRRAGARRAGTWFARVGAVLSIGLIMALGYRALRAAGFGFRWETGGGTGPAVTGRLARQVPVAPPGPVDENPSQRVSGRVETSVLEPPAAGAHPGVAGTGAPARVDFETFGNGDASCTPCAVSDEWAGAGLRVSFRSWTAASTTPYVLDGRDYLPPEVDLHVLGPAFGDRGLEVGVIRLDFPERPRTVTFTLYGPDIVQYFAVTGWTGDLLLSGSIERTGGRTYDVTGRGLFREERIRVTAESGIDRIPLDGWGPPGHMLLVDDVVITP